MDLLGQVRVVESIKNEIVEEIKLYEGIFELPFEIRVLLIALQEAERELKQIIEDGNKHE